VGEIADMMLDGTMCQGCGVWLHDGNDGPGYPGFCADCQPKEGRSGPRSFNAPANPAKVACEVCGRHVKAAGLKDHMRDKHGSQGCWDESRLWPSKRGKVLQGLRGQTESAQLRAVAGRAGGVA
jgi:hypothetical protein